jgi:hypothetical protein
MRFVYAALMVAGSTLPALAQHEPVIVIPGRPDVPVILNGYDVSGAVVEGDWGLERPGHVAPTIVDGPLIPAPYYARGDYLYGRGYYPATGRRPGYGRHEIQPPANRVLPPPAPTYHREYGIESAPNPVTEYPPYDPPQVIVAPRNGQYGNGQYGNGQYGNGQYGNGQYGNDTYDNDGRTRHRMPDRRSSSSPGRAVPVPTTPRHRG